MNKMKLFSLLTIGIWIGLVFGLSFIEAPLKFQAEGITTALALGIGRLVFGASNKIQLVLLTLLLLNIGYNYKSFPKITTWLCAIITLIIASQAIYLLPLLDARAQLIIAGQSVPDSHYHIYFVVLEILKITTLITLFINIYNKWKT